MNKFLNLTVIALLLGACNNSDSSRQVDLDPIAQPVEVSTSAAQDAVDQDAPVIELQESIFEFGSVEEGKIVEHVYTFTNSGNSPLIISNVSASCGCTTPEYSKHPIAPGEQGSVSVAFDSQGQVGKQQKIITILSNAQPSRTILQLKGEVEPKQ